MEKVYFQLLFSEANILLFSTQSRVRLFHSTETSLLKIYNDSLFSCDKDNISLVLCLSFFSVFDTVDHSLLIQQFETSFGISGSCLKWISSHFSSRSFVVSINNFYSTPSFFPFGVLQCSVLGPLLFILYTSELPKIISSFFLQSQLYAEDSSISTSFS